MIRLVLSAIAGYLLGSVSVAVLMTKLFLHADVREQGSGNAGATNVARVFGMKAGVLTLLGSAALLTVPAERVLRRIPAGAGAVGSFARQLSQKTTADLRCARFSFRCAVSCKPSAGGSEPPKNSLVVRTMALF